MRHQIEFTWPDKTRVLRNIGLCAYGDSNGVSAMSKTVGLPCAIATKMVLESKHLNISFISFMRFNPKTVAMLAG